MPTEQQLREFYRTYGPAARKYAQMFGLDPAVLLAINASETNWGNAPGFMGFGITGTGTAGSRNLTSQGSDAPGSSVGFAQYNSPDEAYQHFFDLITGETGLDIYKPAWEKFQQTGDSQQFVRDIQQAGYTPATDWPDIVQSLSQQIGADPAFQASPGGGGVGGPATPGGGGVPGPAQNLESGYVPTWASARQTQTLGPGIDRDGPGRWLDPATGEVKSGPHVNKGTDYALNEGTPIDANIAGEVVSAGPRGTWGTSVQVRDAQGNIHSYNHLSNVYVKPGDQIKPGDILAISGSTGESTGPHLSYDIDRGDGVYIDPNQFLSGAQAAPGSETTEEQMLALQQGDQVTPSPQAPSGLAAILDKALAGTGLTAAEAIELGKLTQGGAKTAEQIAEEMYPGVEELTIGQRANVNEAFENQSAGASFTGTQIADMIRSGELTNQQGAYLHRILRGPEGDNSLSPQRLEYEENQLLDIEPDPGVEQKLLAREQALADFREHGDEQRYRDELAEIEQRFSDTELKGFTATQWRDIVAEDPSRMNEAIDAIRAMYPEDQYTEDRIAREVADFTSAVQKAQEVAQPEPIASALDPYGNIAPQLEEYGIKPLAETEGELAATALAQSGLQAQYAKFKQDNPDVPFSALAFQQYIDQNPDPNITTSYSWRKDPTRQANLDIFEQTGGQFIRDDLRNNPGQNITTTERAQSLEDIWGGQIMPQLNAEGQLLPGSRGQAPQELSRTTRSLLDSGMELNPETGNARVNKGVDQQTGETRYEDLTGGDAYLRSLESAAQASPEGQQQEPVNPALYSYALSLLRRGYGHAGGAEFTTREPLIAMTLRGEPKFVIGEGVDEEGKPIPEEIDVNPKEKPRSLALSLPGVPGFAYGDSDLARQQQRVKDIETRQAVAAAQEQAAQEKAIAESLGYNDSSGSSGGPDDYTKAARARAEAARKTRAGQIGAERTAASREAQLSTSLVNLAGEQGTAESADRESERAARLAFIDTQEANLGGAAQDILAEANARGMRFDLAEQQLGARQGEREALIGAEGDIQNIIDVARGRRQRENVIDPRYARAGISAPQEIQRPLGFEGDISNIPGVRFGLETDADQIRRIQGRNEQARALASEAADLDLNRELQRLGVRGAQRNNTEAQARVALDRELENLRAAGDQRRLSFEEEQRMVELERIELLLEARQRGLAVEEASVGGGSSGGSGFSDDNTSDDREVTNRWR